MKFSRQAPSPKEFVGSVLSAIHGGPYWKSIFKFEPRDVWVGVYWNTTNIERAYAEDFVRSTYRWRIDVWICPLPCCLIRFSVEYGTPKWKGGDMSDFEAGRDKTNRLLAAHKPLNMPPDRTAQIERAINADDGSCSNTPAR